jgi:DNA polymerase III subunit delta
MATFPSPVVVSFGEESFFLDRDLGSFLAAGQGRRLTSIDGRESSESEVLSACETADLEGRERLVVVDNAEKVKFDKAGKAYVAGLSPDDRHVVLALVVRSTKLPAFWAKKDPRIVVLREHRALKSFGSRNDVTAFVETEARRQGLSLDDRVPALLARAVGNDLYRIFSEIRKLRTWLGEGSTVTVERLQATVSVTAGSTVWDVVDAASARDARSAMNALASLYRFASEDPTILLTYSLMKQVERLLVARAAIDKGTPEDEVASRLGIHPYRYRTFFAPLARKHTATSLAENMRRLCRLDAEVKRAPARSKRALVEFAVLHFAR